MTLVTRLKPPAYHKKAAGKHHKHGKKYSKTYWPYLPLLLIVGLGLVFNSTLPGKGAVLGYATDMSIQSLLDDTNAQRQANSLGSLALNQVLNTAAQAKAQDMANRNYWSHNTPDGQTPWTFMTAAGYNYQLAGENLAYGFSTASDTLTGWMNSPGHRANILNTGYKEVGFGFINIANYQNNGPETLVVAMYGTQPASALRQLAAVTPSKPQLASVAPATPTVTNTKTIAPTPAATTTPSAPAPTAETPTATPADPVTTPSESTQPNSPDTATPVQTTTVSPQTATAVEPAAQSVSRLNLLSASNVGWSSATITIIGIVALIVFFLRHGIAWHKILVKGEHFVLRHPLLDVALVTAVTAMFVLIRNVGTIR